MAWAALRFKAVVLWFIVTPIVGVCNCFMFCCTLLYVHSSFASILMGKRELVALLSLSFWCLVIVEWLFLAVPCVWLQFVIVVFPDHTHLLFWIFIENTVGLECLIIREWTFWPFLIKSVNLYLTTALVNREKGGKWSSQKNAGKRASSLLIGSQTP